MLDNGTIVISRDVTFNETSPHLPETNLPKPNLPKTILPETISLIDTDDIESVGAPAEPEAPPSPPIALRRTERAAARRPASLWQDDAYRITSRASTANIATTATEPTTLEEALASEDAELWQQAMDEEMASLLANNTWTLERRPPGIKPIPVKWVLKIKSDANGNIERYKARLVRQGLHQREGIDYDEVFAPVSKYSTLRALLATRSRRDLEIHQLDIKTAFLNGEAGEGRLTQQPPGYDERRPHPACHLQQGPLRPQAGTREPGTHAQEELEAMGFTESTADPGLFIKSASTPVYLLIYVDDILVITADTSTLNAIKDQIAITFDARDLGAATSSLA